MNRKEKESLTAAFTGGGGKTSLIFYLAKKFSSQGKRVIVTTTTHMAWEPKRPFADAEDTEELCRLIEQYGYVIAAKHKAGQPKISGPELETLKRLSGVCDLLLVEADGAKRLPLKVPAVHEPVIPEFADVVVGVTGLDCIGKKICDTAHRPDDVAEFLQKKTEELVMWEDVVKIAAAEDGLRKNVGEKSFLVYFNKADVLESSDVAENIIKKCREAGLEAVCGSLKETMRPAGNMPEVSWNKEEMRDEAGTDHAGSRKQQTVWE